MSKFNEKTKGSNTTINLAGGRAYQPSDENELILRTMSTLIREGKYYQTGASSDQELREIIHRVASKNPEFVLKLAAFARNEMNLRSAPLFLLCELANSGGVGIPNSRKYVPAILKRADELTEILAMQFARNKQFPRDTKIPMLIKNGVAQAFQNFNEYSLGKYNRDAEVKLRDALFLTHPIAIAEGSQKELLSLIPDNKLAIPETWEVVISTKGSTKEAWDEVIPKMGVFALVRNLRNFLKVGADIAPVIAKLTDEKTIRNSKMFPFRFYSAYTMIKQGVEEKNPFDRQMVVNALEVAIKLSMTNIPKMGGKTLIVVDLSGSMTHALSKDSIISYKDISSLFGAMASEIFPQSIVVGFADEMKVIHTIAGTPILQAKDIISRTSVGGSTYAHKVLEWLNKEKISVDRILLFSDMQCYTESGCGNKELSPMFAKYMATVNKNCMFYSMDLAGHGTVQVPESKNVCLIGGWSERILDFVRMYEEDQTTMRQMIENYTV